jgi:NhaP-type Na+/H+ or K+/H+ antiporter
MEKCERIIDQAIRDRIDLLIFPELTLTGYFIKDIVASVAITIDSPILQKLLAYSKRISIVIGAVEETPDFKFYNTAFYLEDGKIVHAHRKVYLPTYGLFDEVLPFWEAAILATILAPTDASLGAVVVNSPLVPQRIREALSVESGLNDGLSMPFFVLFLALAGYEMHGHSHTWVQFTVMQIGFGVLVGFIVGWLGGKLMNWSERKNWMHEGAHLIALLALAVLAWGLANSVGGNGFIAAFVAGSTLRWAYNNAIDYAEEFEDSWGHLLVYFIFFAFGMLAAPWLENITPTIWLYGILSLTLVRMVPVALALSGSKLRPGTILYMGWFGPRGLASVVLGMIYLEELTLLNINQSIILAVIATVLLSVLAHGVSAAPLSQIYARYLAKQPSDAPEFV